MDVIYLIDIIGTFAFAISGALVAIKKNFDVFGVVIIAFVTAVGGGMLRDILIDANPINWIGDINYIYTVLTAVLFTFLFRSRISPLRRTMFLFDTIGISVFTLLGLQKGINFNLHPLIALVMGMVSAVFGGVLRDVLTQKVPLIFKKEIYASACLSGGVVYLVLRYVAVQEDIAFIISAFVIILVRTCSVVYKFELPKIKEDLFTIRNTKN